MIDQKKRERTVRRALLEDLANTPRGYLQPQEALEWLRANMMPYYPLGVYADRDDVFGA